MVLDTPDGEARVKAKRGVILACGGFEADDAMKRQYWQVKPVRSAAFLGNTGDGIRMAQAVGADLWHMWHFHGSYGFRHYDPDYPLAHPGEAPAGLAAGAEASDERQDVLDHRRPPRHGAT